MSDRLPGRPLVGGIITRREERVLVKHLRDLHNGTSLELAYVQAQELVETQKIEALGSVGHVGLAAASSLAAHRRLAAERDPTALRCLDHVTETTVCAIGDRIGRFGRRLG